MQIKLWVGLILCFSLWNLSEASVEEKNSSDHYYLFLSHSIDQKELDQIFAWYEGNEKVTLVFRGVLNEQDPTYDLIDFHNTIFKYKGGLNLVIDPTLFKKFNVTTIPTLIKLDSSDQLLKRVVGISHYEYLRDHNTKEIDLGIKGECFPILERDLIELMQERIAKLNWSDLKNKAIGNFWINQKDLNLRSSHIHQIKKVDLSFTLNKDFTDLNGNIIYAKGTVINPLALKNFGQVLIIFNPNDQSEIQRVKELLADLKFKFHDLDLAKQNEQNQKDINNYNQKNVDQLRSSVTYINNFSSVDHISVNDLKHIKLIVTHLDPNNGWKQLKSLQDQFNQQIYLLDQAIINRFNIEFTPSFIYQVKGEMLITEEILQDQSMS